MSFAQSPAREKPTLKNFGSSLKRLKWDPAKNAAVETKSNQDKANDSNEEDVVRVEASLVVSDVLVLDEHGRSVPGLTRDDFVVTEDGVPQKILTFQRETDRPLSIAFLIDVSASEERTLPQALKDAEQRIVAGQAPKTYNPSTSDDVLRTYREFLAALGASGSGT